MSPVWAILPICVFATIGAYLDWNYRRLPNTLCASLAASGAAWNYVHLGEPGVVWALAHAAIALVIGFCLYAIGWIGGGDAKFYAGFATWFTLPMAPLFAASVTVCGGLLSLIWLFLRSRMAIAEQSARGGRPSASLPYGVAIASGAVAAYTLQFSLSA